MILYLMPFYLHQTFELERSNWELPILHDWIHNAPLISVPISVNTGTVPVFTIRFYPYPEVNTPS